LLRSGNQTPDLIPDAPPIRERESAEVITINNTINLFLKLQSAFQSFQTITVFIIIIINGWWRGTVVERRSLAGELSLSCA